MYTNIQKPSGVHSACVHIFFLYQDCFWKCGKMNYKQRIQQIQYLYTHRNATPHWLIIQYFSFSLNLFLLEKCKKQNNKTLVRVGLKNITHNDLLKVKVMQCDRLLRQLFTVFQSVSLFGTSTCQSIGCHWERALNSLFQSTDLHFFLITSVCSVKLKDTNCTLKRFAVVHIWLCTACSTMFHLFSHLTTT